MPAPYTIPATDRETFYNPSVATEGPFDVGFTLASLDDVAVYRNDILLDPSEYIVGGTLSEHGVYLAPTVTLDTAFTGQLAIVGARSPRREDQFTEGAGVSALSLNLSQNRLAIETRENYEGIKASLRHGPADDAPFDAGGRRIEDGATPLTSTDFATKGYSDSGDATVAAAIGAEASVRSAADLALVAADAAEATTRANADIALTTALENKADLVGGVIPASQLPSGFLGGIIFQGSWDADANDPVIPPADEDNLGWQYVVGVAGDTEIDGISEWNVGDMLVSNGTAWERYVNVQSVTSVAGKTGAVTLDADDIGLAKADEATAEAGTDDADYMTAAVSKAAIISWQQTIYATRYGVSPDNDATDNTANWNTLLIPAIQALSTAERPITVEFEIGNYEINDELVHTALTRGFRYKGQGHHNTTFSPTSFGRTKKLFKLDFGAKTSRVKYVDLIDFRIQGNADQDDPVAVYQPWVSTSQHDIKIVQVWNTNVRIREVDNSEFSWELTGAGYQDLTRRFTTAAYASVTGTSLIVKASSAGGAADFTNALQGLPNGTWVYIENADGSHSGNAGTAMRKISSASGASANLDFTMDNAPFDQTAGNRISTGPIVVDVTDGSATVVANENGVITELDIGREYYIKDAGLSGRIFCSTLTGRSGTSLTFADTIETYDGNPITNAEIYTAPPLAILHQASDLATAPNLTNDVQIHRLWIEGYQGPGFIIGECSHVRILDGKVHGKVGVVDFAASRENEIWTAGGDCYSRLVRTQLSVGGHPTAENNGAAIYLSGGNPELEVAGSLEIFENDVYAVELFATADTTATNTAGVLWGPNRCLTSRKKSPFKFRGNASFRNILHKGRVRNNALTSDEGVAPLEGINQMASFYSQNILVNNNEVRIWTPAVTGGKFTFYSSGGTFGDRIWEGYLLLRTGASIYAATPTVDPVAYYKADDVFAGASWAVRAPSKNAVDVVTTDGPNAKLTIVLTNDTKIVLINRNMGASVRIAATCRFSFD